MNFKGYTKFCLVHIKKDNKMPLSARLIYSLLVYRAVFDKGLTANGIAERLHMNRYRSVGKWLNWLKDHNLVVKVANEWFALKGDPDLFSYRTETVDKHGKALSWCQQMAKIPMVEWNKGIPITSSQVCLYFQLVNFQQRNRMDKVSIRHLGRLLGIDRVTVRSGLSALVQCGLINVDTKITLNELTAIHKSWFKVTVKNMTRIEQYRLKNIEAKEKVMDGYVNIEDSGLMEKEVQYFFNEQVICKKSDYVTLSQYLIKDLYKVMQHLKQTKPVKGKYLFTDVESTIKTLMIKPDVDDTIVEEHNPITDVIQEVEDASFTRDCFEQKIQTRLGQMECSTDEDEEEYYE